MKIRRGERKERQGESFAENILAFSQWGNHHCYQYILINNVIPKHGESVIVCVVVCYPLSHDNHF